MTAQLTETGTRLCRTCKNPLPAQGRGRPRAYCLDCRPPHSDRKTVIDDLRRYQGFLPNGRAVLIVASPDGVKLAMKRMDGSSSWGVPIELENVKGSTWVGTTGGTEGGLTVTATVFRGHITVRLAPPTMELRFERVTP